jgi:hypothetical protein
VHIVENKADPHDHYRNILVLILAAEHVGSTHIFLQIAQDGSKFLDTPMTKKVLGGYFKELVLGCPDIKVPEGIKISNHGMRAEGITTLINKGMNEQQVGQPYPYILINPAFSLQPYPSNLIHPALSIQPYPSNLIHPALSIQPYPSSLIHPALSIQPYPSSLIHPTLSIQPYPSNLIHPTLSIQPYSSNLIHPTLSIQPYRSCHSRDMQAPLLYQVTFESRHWLNKK